MKKRNVALYRSRPTPFNIYIHTHPRTKRIGMPNLAKTSVPPLFNTTLFSNSSLFATIRRKLSHSHGESPPDLPLLLSILLVAACVCGRRSGSFYANTRTLPLFFFQQMQERIFQQMQERKTQSCKWMSENPMVWFIVKTQWFGLLWSIRTSFSSFLLVTVGLGLIFLQGLYALL